MSRWRRFLHSVLGVLLMGWLLVVIASLHLPTPSGVRAEHEASVREIWRGAAHAAQRVSPLSGDSRLVDWLGDDKMLHVLIFLPLGLLWTLRRRLGRQPVAKVVIGGLLVFAVLSELLQGLGGRIADPLDVAANLLGAVLGWAAAIVLYRLGRMTRHRWRPSPD